MRVGDTLFPNYLVEDCCPYVASLTHRLFQFSSLLAFMTGQIRGMELSC